MFESLGAVNRLAALDCLLDLHVIAGQLFELLHSAGDNSIRKPSSMVDRSVLKE